MQCHCSLGALRTRAPGLGCWEAIAPVLLGLTVSSRSGPLRELRVGGSTPGTCCRPTPQVPCVYARLPLCCHHSFMGHAA